MSDVACNANGTGHSRPDLSSEQPDAVLSKEKLQAAGGYLRAILEPEEISKLFHAKGANGAFTASLVITILKDGEQIAERKRRKHHVLPGQTSLFVLSDPPSSSGDLVSRVADAFTPIVVQVAADTVAEKVVEAITPVVEKIKDQGDANEANLAAAVGDIKEIKETLAVLAARSPSPAIPALDAQAPLYKLSGRGKSAYYGPLEDDLLAAFSESFRQGREGDVPRETILALAVKHDWRGKRDGKVVDGTFNDMVQRHLGTVTGRKVAGVHYWRVTKDALEAALALRASERAMTKDVPVEQATKKPAMQEPVAQELTTKKLASRQARRPSRHTWPKKVWKDGQKVKVADVLRRFEPLGVTENRLYRWIKEDKVTCMGGRVEGGHYEFFSDDVAKQIGRLLREEASNGGQS